MFAFLGLYIYIYIVMYNLYTFMAKGKPIMLSKYKNKTYKTRICQTATQSKEFIFSNLFINAI